MISALLMAESYAGICGTASDSFAAYAITAFSSRQARRLRNLQPFRQRARACVNRVLAQQLLDAQELVVFRQAIRAAQRAGLDLAAVRRHRNVRDGRAFGFTGTMAEDGGYFVGSFAVKSRGKSIMPCLIRSTSTVSSCQR